SFYQYYPNKESLLFHLHKIETEKTWNEMERILDNTGKSHRERIFEVVDYFFRSEAEEKELRKSLNSVAIFFHQTKEFKALELEIFSKTRRFLGEFLNEDNERLSFKTDVFL